MYQNVLIKSIGIYHPENVVDNAFFVKHFSAIDEDLGVKVDHLLEHLGRKNRYIGDFPKENILTMAEVAAKEALDKAGLAPSDLDGIIFSTDTPEYTSPSNAIFLRDKIGAEHAHVCYDLNANCVGMVVAVDQGTNLLRSNSRIQRLLVVGSSMIHHYGDSSDPITYACIGDAAAAVILEKSTDSSTYGFIDALYKTKDDLKDHILMPGCGLSNLYANNLENSKKRWLWEPFDTDEGEERCVNMIRQIVDDNHLSLKAINKVLMTQFSLASIKNVADELNLPLELFKYVGDQYAYTGTSSPFIAYYHALLDGEIQSGDTIIFWSAGSGLTTAGLLYTVK